MAVFALLALGFIIWLVSLSLEDFQLSSFMGLLPVFLIPAVLIAFLASLVIWRLFKTKRNRQRIHFYKQGIEWMHDDKRERFRYEDLKTLFNTVTVKSRLIPLGRFRSRWLVLLSDGLLDLENDEIWYPLREKILESQLPQAIAAYQKGDAVGFGAIRISSEGLDIKHAGALNRTSKQNRLIPWTNVGEIFIRRSKNGERFCIKKPKSLTTSAEVQASEIHNLHVLVSLLSHLGYMSAAPAPAPSTQSGTWDGF